MDGDDRREPGRGRHEVGAVHDVRPIEPAAGVRAARAPPRAQREAGGDRQAVPLGRELGAEADDVAVQARAVGESAKETSMSGTRRSADRPCER